MANKHTIDGVAMSVSRYRVQREVGFWTLRREHDGVTLVARDDWQSARRILEELEVPGVHYPSEAYSVARAIERHEEVA